MSWLLSNQSITMQINSYDISLWFIISNSTFQSFFIHMHTINHISPNTHGFDHCCHNSFRSTPHTITNTISTHRQLINDSFYLNMAHMPNAFRVCFVSFRSQLAGSIQLLSSSLSSSNVIPSIVCLHSNNNNSDNNTAILNNSSYICFFTHVMTAFLCVL